MGNVIAGTGAVSGEYFVLIVYLTLLFLEPKRAVNQQPMRPQAEWAIEKKLFFAAPDHQPAPNNSASMITIRF